MKDIEERTFNFALRIIKICQVLDKIYGIERTLSKQLLLSGTSVGANVQEAQSGQSKADFISKLSIALKESRETLYWIRLLEASQILSTQKLSAIKKEAEEITKILAAIIVSAKKKHDS